ncbi:MAG: hypothetical protein H6618_07815 [Deltaproteobacteria bacterium]|nr:hypothetical protein [Deltaproteobacteria bacterium]
MHVSFLWSLPALFLLWGCASYTEKTREIRGQYLSGKYQQALDELESSGLKDETNSALLYHLEKAVLLDRLGERPKSRQLLMQANRIADELYTVSVSKSAASYLVNDGVQDYEGELYERVHLHTLLALSFLQDKAKGSARVEARKINTELHELTRQLGTEHNAYREDAFARFLAGLIYEAGGDVDDAIIDYKKALDLYEGPAYRPFFQGDIPEELISSLYQLARRRGRKTIQEHLRKGYPGIIQGSGGAPGDKKLGELVVIHEVGMVAPKQAKEFIFSFGRQVIRFSYPYLPERYYPAQSAVGIVPEGQGFIRASNVADINSIAWQCLEDRRGRMLLKNASRLLLKGQLTEHAHSQFGPLGGLAANIYSAVTETADTRSWTLLPGAFYVNRVSLPPGEHRVTIRHGGRFVGVETVQVRPGSLTLLRSVSS